MKIKSDFVTNSSSTAYIVIVPDILEQISSFDQLEKLMNFEAYEWESHFNENEEEAIAGINQNLQTLKSGHSLYQEDTQGFHTTLEYLRKKNLVLKEIDSSGGGGEDVIQPVALSEIHQILNRIESL